MADLSHEAWRARCLPELDPGIAPYVDALREAGVETFESCEGGEGHCYAEPAVRFSGDLGDGFRAVAVALEHGFPVQSIRRVWDILEGEPRGPHWEMAFWWAANGPEAQQRDWGVDESPMPYADRLVRDGRLQRTGDGDLVGPCNPGWVEATLV